MCISYICVQIEISKLRFLFVALVKIPQTLNVELNYIVNNLQTLSNFNFVHNCFVSFFFFFFYSSHKMLLQFKSDELKPLTKWKITKQFHIYKFTVFRWWTNYIAIKKAYKQKQLLPQNLNELICIYASRRVLSLINKLFKTMMMMMMMKKVGKLFC